MVREIIGFHQDEAGDWVAELSCLHNQHVRHRPPFQEREWVLDPAGRSGRLGSRIECPLCDRAELPDGLAVLRVAGPWDQDGLPPGLRRPHRTAQGVWGVLRVTEGAVGFRMATSRPLDVVLAAGSAQPIPPAVPHEIRVDGAARLLVELWGRPA